MKVPSTLTFNAFKSYVCVFTAQDIQEVGKVGGGCAYKAVQTISNSLNLGKRCPLFGQESNPCKQCEMLLSKHYFRPSELSMWSPAFIHNFLLGSAKINECVDHMITVLMSSGATCFCILQKGHDRFTKLKTLNFTHTTKAGTGHLFFRLGNVSTNFFKKWTNKL